jgi:hypothetical protein
MAKKLKLSFTQQIIGHLEELKGDQAATEAFLFANGLAQITPDFDRSLATAIFGSFRFELDIDEIYTTNESLMWQLLAYWAKQHGAKYIINSATHVINPI